MTPRSLLLVQLHYLGDVLLATPAVRAARRAFPDAHIDFVTGAAGAEALEGNPHIDRVHRFERGVRGRFDTLRALRAARYDAVVDFHSQPSSAQLVAATRAPVRIGLVGRGPRNLAYTQLLPRERGPVYMALQKLRMLTPLGVDACDADTGSSFSPLNGAPSPPRSSYSRLPDTAPTGSSGDAAGRGPDLHLEIALSPEDHAFAQAVFQRHGLAGDAPVVAVSAVARHAFKQWGAERWAALADRVMDAGARVLLTHGPGEEDQAAAVVERMHNQPVWRYGLTTVKQLAALYARTAVWVGNDGGPKHLAAAAGTATISVVRWRLGPVWSDLRPDSGQLAFDPPPPQGCDRACKRCEHIGCLAAVSVDEVADAVLACLESGRGSRRGGAHE